MVLSLSCTSSDGFILKGEVSNAVLGEGVRLFYPVFRDGVWYERELKADIVDGLFVFEGELDDMTFAHIAFDDMYSVPIFLEPRRMSIEIDRESPYAYIMRGVSISHEYDEYRNYLGELPKLIYEQNRRVQDLNKVWLDAVEAESQSADSLMMKFYTATQEFKSIISRGNELQLQFLTEHLGYSIAPYLLYESAFREVTDKDVIRTLYNNLSDSMRETAMGRLVKIRVDIATTDTGGDIGDKAFDFERCNVGGESVQMSEYLVDGEYLLLDFWASWCLPCLQQIPDLKRAYDRYNQQGVKFIGISSDDDLQAWCAAIEKYNLASYPQILSVEVMEGDDEPFFDELVNIAEQYEVSSIPCYILINSDGEIVARWQHFTEEIFSYLDTLLTK